MSTRMHDALSKVISRQSLKFSHVDLSYLTWSKVIVESILKATPSIPATPIACNAHIMSDLI
jgi:hypothetical protein